MTSTNSRAKAWTAPDNNYTIGFTLSNLQFEDARNYYCSMIPPGGGDISKSQLVYLGVLGKLLIFNEPFPELTTFYAHYS